MAAAAPVYFRSDGGVAADATRLPGKFEAPAWKTELASGHSTPVISGERIFLTSYDASSNELATLALDQRTGKLLWKQAAPALKIES
ncbi:MAG TPA: hypothetical protein VFC26_05785, partial [Verrucomicrobiae bacterium]|nr:hypothetical protein [Verrucomicrobiae bacterium]